MTDQPSAAPIRLDRDQAASLARLLREIEQFLGECDESVEEALAAHFGLDPTSEAYSAALCFHADRIEATLAAEDPRNGHPQGAFAQVRAQPG
ncbi:hypothetical protein [Streptomyces sp. NBC_01233]|uniref:hypothetical protein n=1 Tax=Streptomyces sp. NBC_01233 TaxID=2903787 RepID=UPI002E151128|nr:hypothetical protein OG332_00125 [Streptomyces sp. NBC_01233]WSP95322.1 hypothetical protein OG332_46860 [Streptomyces sp. NBC_01233]